VLASGYERTAFIVHVLEQCLYSVYLETFTGYLRGLQSVVITSEGSSGGEEAMLFMEPDIMTVFLKV